MPKIAIVVPEVREEGGVKAVARFVEAALVGSEFSSEIVSIAAHGGDPLSTRLRRPATWRARPGLARDTDGLGVHTRVGSAFGDLEFMLYWPRRELTALLDGFDLVQFVTNSPAWGFAARDVKRPVVIQTATLVARERGAFLRGGGRRRWWRRLLARATDALDHRAVARADAVLVENGWMHDLLRARHGDKIVFAPPGVDADFFAPSADRADEAPYVLSVGRWNDPRKNVSLLLRAYARLRAALPDAPRLVLAGWHPPDEAAFALMAALGIAPHVEVRRAPSAVELRALYRGARLFALSSEEEGLGLVLLEAMACGAPVVSTACGGPETMIRHGLTGLLVPVGDEEALASAMCRVLTDAELARALSVRGREVVEAQFSVQSARERFLATYRALLARRAAG